MFVVEMITTSCRISTGGIVTPLSIADRMSKKRRLMAKGQRGRGGALNMKQSEIFDKYPDYIR